MSRRLPPSLSATLPCMDQVRMWNDWMTDHFKLVYKYTYVHVCVCMCTCIKHGKWFVLDHPGLPDIFESHSNGLNLCSSASNPVGMVEIRIQVFQICIGIVWTFEWFKRVWMVEIRIRVVQICNWMFRIPFEWFEFAFVWFEFASECLKFHSNAWN